MIRRSLPLLCLLAAACARPEAPPGGPEDLLPPFVVETRPDTFAAVEAGVREVHFRFSERISERPANGTLNDAVVVSPSTGNLRVSHSRDGISVEMQEGMEAGRLYKVTVLPVINDMFGNRLRDPFELVVSTGEEFVPNVVAGMVEDRVTGQASPDVRVEARFPRDGDTVTHWNLTGTDGVFSLRYVPDGPYEVRAWQDRNRDNELGDNEPQSDFVPGELLSESPDTTFAILSLIEPDTLPARLARVTAEDSVTLTFEFDDYLEPELPGVLVGARVVVAAVEEVVDDSVDVGEVGDTTEVVEVIDTVTVGDLPDTVAAAEAPDTVPVAVPGDTVAIRIFQPRDYERWLAERADSAAQAAAAEQAAEAAEAGVEAPVEAPEEPADTAEVPEGPVGLSGLLLPSQTLVGVLEEGLQAGVAYEAVISSVVNIAGLGGGGGTALVVWEPPPPDTTEVQKDSLLVGDSTVVGDSDTTEVVPDTTEVVPDTTEVVPDTTEVVPDTTVIPDTMRVGPDTARSPWKNPHEHRERRGAGARPRLRRRPVLPGR